MIEWETNRNNKQTIKLSENSIVIVKWLFYSLIVVFKCKHTKAIKVSMKMRNEEKKLLELFFYRICFFFLTNQTIWKQSWLTLSLFWLFSPDSGPVKLTIVIHCPV